MLRRDMLLCLGSLPVLAWGRGLAQPSVSTGWRTFEITTRVEIAQPEGRTVLWLPIPWAGHAYQRLLAVQPDVAGGRMKLLSVPGEDARMLQVEWPHADAVGPVTLLCRVATRDRRLALEGGEGSPVVPERELKHYLRSTRWLPTDGVVKELAQRITGEQQGAVPKARAIYEWVVQRTRREATVRGCGLGDVVSLLQSGDFRGKCADINGLFVALARAAGVPARDAYGIRVADSRWGFKSLGKSVDITKAQHCRAEFHAQGLGWVPVDPADVRKVMLEEVPGGLPFEDSRVQAAYSALFGSWEMNWIAYNHAHDVALPGAEGAPLPFLMYPQAQTAQGRLDCLDPAAFRYEIRSREVTSV